MYEPPDRWLDSRHRRTCTEVSGTGDVDVRRLLAGWVLTAIEQEFGDRLVWEDLENRRACRVAYSRPGSILDSQEKLDEYLAWTVERLLRLKAVFGPRLPRV